MNKTAGAGGGFFTATIWSTVLMAKDQDEAVRLAALGRLLERYQGPITREIQARQRCDADRAKDLCQEFIKECLRRDFLKNVNPEFGRFRTFLQQCIQNFLRDVHARETAKCRGGGDVPLSMDETDEEGHPLIVPPDTQALSPDFTMDRAWAEQILASALAQLERECVAARRGVFFHALKGCLGGEQSGMSAREVGHRLGVSESAVNVAMHRLRQRLGELVEEEIKQTVGTQEDWRDELRYLLDLLRK